MKFWTMTTVWGIDHTKFMFDFFWGIHNLKVPKTKILICVGDTKMSTYLVRRLEHCPLTSFEGASTSISSRGEIYNALRQLTKGISHQNESIRESNTLLRVYFNRKKDKGDKKKNRMSNLHSLVTHFILNASSTDRICCNVSQQILCFFF